MFPSDLQSYLRPHVKHVALSCAPVRMLRHTHRLESTLMHWSAPMGALPWAQPMFFAPDWLNLVLICNIADGLLDYAKVSAYLATHSQTNTYKSPQNRWHSATHRPPAQTFSYRLPCWIVTLRQYDTWLSRWLRRFLCSKKTWSAPVGAGIALRSAPQLWRNPLERSLMQRACGLILTVDLLAQSRSSHATTLWITISSFVVKNIVFTTLITNEKTNEGRNSDMVTRWLHMELVNLSRMDISLV